jgi:hypothetical protein
VATGEVGPDGHRVGYTEEGDKVEWLPDEEHSGKVWPMILRRNDDAIIAAEREFMNVIWYIESSACCKILRTGERQ